MTNSSDRFAVSEEVVAREVGGETVLLDLASGMYFGLDAVGARVWELLSGEAHSHGVLSDRIVDEYDAPRERIEADLTALLDDLTERGLVVRSAG